MKTEERTELLTNFNNYATKTILVKDMETKEELQLTIVKAPYMKFSHFLVDPVEQIKDEPTPLSFFFDIMNEKLETLESISWTNREELITAGIIVIERSNEEEKT